MLVFYDSLVENTNCQITVNCFEIVFTEKVYFQRKKSCIEKNLTYSKKELVVNTFRNRRIKYTMDMSQLWAINNPQERTPLAGVELL